MKGKEELVVCSIENQYDGAAIIRPLTLSKYAQIAHFKYEGVYLFSRVTLHMLFQENSIVVQLPDKVTRTPI